MKVVINVESLAVPLTGIGYYTKQLVAGLREQQNCQLKCFFQTRIVDPADIEVGRLVHGDRSPRWIKTRQFIRKIPGAYRLRSYIRDHVFSRVTSDPFYDAIYHEPNYILKPFDGVTISTVHDLSFIHYPDFHPPERVRYMEREFPKTLNRATHFITDSNYVKNELITTFGVSSRRITTVPLGVASHFCPRTPTQVHEVLSKYHLSYGRYLLSVATLEPRKNLSGLIDAYLRLPVSVRRHFPLVLVGGRGWQCHSLEKKIDQLELAGELKSLGYLAALDLPAIYSAAGAFAFPSHYEGFGLPPLEAMASGVPVLVADNSAMAEVVGEAGILVDSSNDDDIYAGLQRLLLDDSFRQAVSHDGLLRASTFTWERCVNKTLEVYRQVKN